MEEFLQTWKRRPIVSYSLGSVSHSWPKIEAMISIARMKMKFSSGCRDYPLCCKNSIKMRACILSIQKVERCGRWCLWKCDSAFYQRSSRKNVRLWTAELYSVSKRRWWAWNLLKNDFRILMWCDLLYFCC